MPEAIRPGGKKNQTCFFYGTLMVPSVLTRVIYGTTRPEPYQTQGLRIRPAILTDYVRRKVRYADYPGIIPEKGSTVRGTLVEGLTEWDIKRLDAFEGSEYTLGHVKVHVVGREAPVVTSEGVIQREGDWQDPEGEADVDAMTYIYSAGAHRLEPEMWDFNHFLKERLYLWAGDDSAEYAEVDQLAWLTGGEMSSNSSGVSELVAEDDKKMQKEKKKSDSAVSNTSTTNTLATTATATTSTTSKPTSTPTVPAVEAA